MKLFIPLCALLIGLPAHCQEQTISVTPSLRTLPPAALQDIVRNAGVQIVLPNMDTPTTTDDEPTLIDSHRQKRKHWYTPALGKKVYTYKFGDHEVVCGKYLKVFADRRPWAQQHPVKQKVRGARKKCEFIGPFLDVGSGAFNGLRAAGIIR